MSSANDHPWGLLPVKLVPTTPEERKLEPDVAARISDDTLENYNHNQRILAGLSPAERDKALRWRFEQSRKQNPDPVPPGVFVDLKSRYDALTPEQKERLKILSAKKKEEFRKLYGKGAASSTGPVASTTDPRLAAALAYFGGDPPWLHKPAIEEPMPPRQIEEVKQEDRRKRRVSQVDKDMRKIRPSADLKIKRALDPSSEAGLVVTDQAETVSVYRKADPQRHRREPTFPPPEPAVSAFGQRKPYNPDRLGSDEPERVGEDSKMGNAAASGNDNQGGAYVDPFLQFGYLLGSGPEQGEVLLGDEDMGNVDDDDGNDDSDPDNILIVEETKDGVSVQLPPGIIPPGQAVNAVPIPQPETKGDAVSLGNLAPGDPDRPVPLPVVDGSFTNDGVPLPAGAVPQLPARPPAQEPPPQPPQPPPPPPPTQPFGAPFNLNGIDGFIRSFMEMARADGYNGPSPVDVGGLTLILDRHSTRVQQYRDLQTSAARAIGFPDEQLGNIVAVSNKVQPIIASFKRAVNLTSHAVKTVLEGKRPEPDEIVDVPLSAINMDAFATQIVNLKSLAEQTRLAMPPEWKTNSMIEHENRVLASIVVAQRVYNAAGWNVSPDQLHDRDVEQFAQLVNNSISLWNRLVDPDAQLGLNPPLEPGITGQALAEAITHRIAALRNQFQLTSASYLASRQRIAARLQGVPDTLGENWVQQDNPQASVDVYNNRLDTTLQQLVAQSNGAQQRLGAILQAFGFNVDPAAANYDELLARAAQQYQNTIRLSPLAALVANVLEREGVNAQNADEVKTALGRLVADVVRSEDLQRQLDGYRELRVLLDQTNIPISRLKNFMAKHGRDPEANLRKLLDLSAERENVIAYGQFCAVMFRQLFVTMAAIISKTRDSHLNLVTSLQNFFAENHSVFVDNTIRDHMEQLQAILNSQAGYRLRYQQEGPNAFEFISRGQPVVATTLFDRCESITRMCGAVLLEMDPRAERNVRGMRGTMNEVWSLLDQFHLDWAERTVKLAESLVIPDTASAGRFTQTIDRTLALLSNFTREGFELGDKLSGKASDGIESMRISMIREMERLKTDLNNRVGRVVVDNMRVLDYQLILQDDETKNPDRGLEARIPLREYFRHLNAFYMDLAVNFNGHDAARELRSQQLLSNQLSTQQTRLINATRDVRDLRSEKARLEARFKEVSRVYTMLDNYSRDAVLYMSQRVASATATNDVLDGKMYETLIAAYQQEVKGEPLNEDVLMNGEHFNYRPPKVLEVARALSGVLELALKRKDGCSKEVKQFLGAFGDAVKKYVDATNSFKQAIPGEDVDVIDTAMTVSVNDLDAAERAVKIIVSGFLKRAKAEVDFVTGFNKDSVELVVRNDTVSAQAREVIGEDIRQAGAALIASDLKSAGVAHRMLVARFMKLVAQAEKLLSQTDKLEEKLGKAETKIQMDKFKDALYKGLSRELGLNGRDGRNGVDGKNALADLVNTGLSMGPGDLGAAIGKTAKESSKLSKSMLQIPGQNGFGRAGTANWLGSALSMRRIQNNDKIKVIVAPRYMPTEGATTISCSYQQIYSFAQKVTGTADVPLSELLQPICPGMDVSSHEFKILLAHVDRLKEIHGDEYGKWWTEETKEVAVGPDPSVVPAIRGVPLVPRVDPETKGDEEDGAPSSSSSSSSSGSETDEPSNTKRARPTSKDEEVKEREVKQQEDELVEEDMGDEEAMRDYETGEQMRKEGRDVWLRTNNNNKKSRRNRTLSDEVKQPKPKSRDLDRDKDRLQTPNERPRQRRQRSDPANNPVDSDMEPLVDLNGPRSATNDDLPTNGSKSKKRTKSDSDKEEERLYQEAMRRDLAGEPPLMTPRRKILTIVKANDALNEREKAHRTMVTELIDKILYAAGKPVTAEELDKLHRDVFNKQVRLFVEQTAKLETCTSGQMFEDLLANYVSYNLCQLIITRVNMMRNKYKDLTAHELMVAHGVVTEFANLMGAQLKRKESTRTSGYYSAKAREEITKDLYETSSVIDKLMRRNAPYDWVRKSLTYY